MERPYLFLDEATSALDENSEKNYQKYFYKLPRNYNIFISHRQTVLENFDVVLKLEDRRVFLTSSPNVLGNLSSNGH